MFINSLRQTAYMQPQSKRAENRDDQFTFRMNDMQGGDKVLFKSYLRQTYDLTTMTVADVQKIDGVTKLELFIDDACKQLKLELSPKDRKEKLYKVYKRAMDLETARNPAQVGLDDFDGTSSLLLNAYKRIKTKYPGYNTEESTFEDLRTALIG